MILLWQKQAIEIIVNHMLPRSYSTKPSRRKRRVPALSLHHGRSTALKDPSF